MPALTVRQIAELCGATAEGETDRLITGANALSDAAGDELSFAENEKAIEAARTSKAGCILMPESFAGAGEWSVIRVREPRVAFMRTLEVLYPQKRPAPSVHPTAIIALTATLAADCYIGPYVVIGEHAAIGSRCVIHAGCRIGEETIIGSDTTLHANVVLYPRVRIGSRVLLHAGCVIGADGFGFVFVKDHYEKFPQVGSVEIEDDVEIGVHSCVDRAALGVTRVQQGTKLDNLVHVAHNCTLGRHVVVAAQTGFSGGVTVGDYAVFGGQVGVADKAKIDAKAIIGAQSGIVTSQHVAAGEPVWGTPARPIKQHLRGLAHVGKLPTTLQEIKEMKRRLSEVEAALQSRSET